MSSNAHCVSYFLLMFSHCCITLQHTTAKNPLKPLKQIFFALPISKNQPTKRQNQEQWKQNKKKNNPKPLKQTPKPNQTNKHTPTKKPRRNFTKAQASAYHLWDQFDSNPLVQEPVIRAWQGWRWKIDAYLSFKRAQTRGVMQSYSSLQLLHSVHRS